MFDPVGRGGFASVHYGRHLQTGRAVAIKRLHPHLLDQVRVVERFEKEAPQARGLAHPHVVEVLDQGRDTEGVPCIVLEWVEGWTLEQRLAAQGQFGVAEALELVDQVLDGLVAVHGRGIVHRDLKPANLMVTPSGQLKIMDFGVAKQADLAGVTASTFGHPGTAAYMAPEQFGNSTLDARSDLYAVSVTLYELLAGRPPFEGPSWTDYLRQHLRAAPMPVHRHRAEVPRGLSALIQRGLAKAPRDRFASALAMRAALRPFLQAAAEPSTPAFAQPTPKPARPSMRPRRPIAAWLTGIAGPVVAVIGVWWLYQVFEPRPTSTPPPPLEVPTLMPTNLLIASGLTPLVTGASRWRVLVGSGQLRRPGDLQVDSQGRLWVADSGNNRVLKLSPTGETLQRMGRSDGGASSQPGEFSNPQGLQVDEDQGVIYVADTGNHRIQKLTPAGVPVAQWGAPNGQAGDGPGEFDHPMGLALDDDGNVYVADSWNNRVQKLSPAGLPLNAWGPFDRPSAVALDGQGNMYVAEFGSHQVQRLSPTGQRRFVGRADGQAGSGSGELNSPGALAVDAQDNVYVADNGNNRIQKVSALGLVVAEWDKAHGVDLDEPDAVAVDVQGAVYVAEAGSGRIQELPASRGAVGDQP